MAPREEEPTGIRLVPVGVLDPGRAAGLAARLSRRVAAPCRVLPPMPRDGLPEIPERGQLDADRLLRRLEGLADASGAVVLGVTSDDLAIPVFTFVFGRARQGGRAAVVSLARLDSRFYGLPADAGRTTERAVLETLHELGHVAGLPHCPDFACLMRFAASVEALDVRGPDFCARCAARLPAWLGGPPRGT